ncbi:uncharacterized protein EI90DRAFT_3019007 [Cantharellus anzutake]|uniref:uncharacterized protein n=1 Tax=Cantharellus anzutake TaxID=1750568 RepID=UPI0019044E66|nr:uncharacterized protein EI90DRAFT_3019007 [Cantharellus anzutake]KAF8325548.1 hypothetical protein EI90DRAFT_3019007 [Cantharellus anzutake]
MWRNVPIPGSFSINDFQDRVIICGQLWVMQGQNDMGQWRWTHFMLPFLNTPDGFKFLINLNWIDKHAVNSIDNAPPEFKRLALMPGVIKEAGMKYILTSFWKHHPSDEAKGFPPPPPEVSTVPPLNSEDTSMSGESSFVEQTEAIPPATLATRRFPAAQRQHMAAAEDDGAGPSTNPQANMPGPSSVA